MQILQVWVTRYEKIENQYVYIIELEKSNQFNASQQLKRPYKDCVELNKALEKLGFPNLPKLPDTFFFNTSANHEKRTENLQAYLQALI